MALFGENDSAQSLWFAQQAATAATRAGDYVDLQNALVLMLSLETRRGNADRAVQIEKQLADFDLATRSIRAPTLRRARPIAMRGSADTPMRTGSSEASSIAKATCPTARSCERATRLGSGARRTYEGERRRRRVDLEVSSTATRKSAQFAGAR